MAVLERSSATPAAIRSYFDWLLRLDIQEVLRAVQAPTAVIHIPNALMPEAAVRHVAELIPTSTFHALPPTPVGSSIGQVALPATDHARGIRHRDRPLDRTPTGRSGTVLFTDVVASTELLERVGRRRRIGSCAPITNARCGSRWRPPAAA